MDTRCMPVAVNVLPSAWIADGATGAAPPGCRLLCEKRPTCHSWQTILPPAAWTASVTSFQPATCSSVQMPGVSA